MSDWRGELCVAVLSNRVKKQHTVIIEWFLKYCRNQTPPWKPGWETANQFDQHLRKTRQPLDWQLRQWRDGLRWYLRHLGLQPKDSPHATERYVPDSETIGLDRVWRESLIRRLHSMTDQYKTTADPSHCSGFRSCSCENGKLKPQLRKIG